MNEMILIHHGINGQKWGVRNGPPYPLDQDDLSPAERKADTGDIKRVERDRKERIIKKDYSNMSDADLRKTVERMELENRYLRAIDASKGKSFIEQKAATLNNIAQIMESTNKILQFTTGKNFAQNIAAIADNSKKKLEAENKQNNKPKKKSDNITDIWNEVSKTINTNHTPSKSVRKALNKTKAEGRYPWSN